MGRAPRELTPWESTLHFFGAELRHWRMLRALSQARLGRRTHDSGEPLPADLGLMWSASTAATVEVVGKLWRADMQRRPVLMTAA